MLFALAAHFSLPTPTNTRIADVRAIFTADDVPAYLVDQGEVDRTVYTRTTVRPDGSTQSCVAEASSGDQKLDAYTCALIIRRAKLSTARWLDGSAAYGVIRLPVRWTVGDSVPGSREDVPDLVLSVNHLPKGANAFVDVDLQIAADEKGHAVSCTEWAPPINDYGKHFSELVPIACQQATASLVLTPPLDTSGKPVRSVQSVSVHFKLGQ